LKRTFVLVDFENIQPADIALLAGPGLNVKIFVGPTQKIPVKTAAALQSLGSNAEYIQLDGAGKNALDFHIAYYAGRLAAQAPDAAIYLVSKDTGFDPLIKHLAACCIACRRITTIADVETRSAPKSASLAAKVDVVVANLAKRKTAKPKRLSTLRTTIRAQFENAMADAELDRIVDELGKKGAISIVDGAVEYDELLFSVSP
jgi:hypothetical protein